MKVVLVDPSLFTGPYDAALSEGLEANGIDPCWAVRQPRPGEEIDLPPSRRAAIFYPLTDGANRAKRGSVKWLKGGEHFAGLFRLARLAARQNADLVHFQWAPLPSFDRLATIMLQRRVPVVLTVHDTTPFNGVDVSPLQRHGLDALMRTVDQIVVHTTNARGILIGEGIDPARISVIPHGPLPLRAVPRPEFRPDAGPDSGPAGRTRIVLFGRIQSYKGVDVLIEALGRLSPERRARLEVVVAGEALIPIEPLETRADALGIDKATLDIRPERLSEQAAADLLASADAFVYPYRAIETSGVFYLSAGFRKWTIASALGSFKDLLSQPAPAGRLVRPGDVDDLTAALDECVGGAPIAAPLTSIPDWDEIGAATRAMYRRLIDARAT